ncbi:hypothetical protein Lal_00048153 [Lupinus albus]|uniref:Putative RNA recognition motif domain-containing protein n=1 Tax=Lupinus albus TaxID=3870 RepID=A0A6A4QPE7_LUPAL|nr:putative RNA recognition motif domain-containing protein [Lupinus albus]KAF1868874.1 hypothetical protein Lal_00048153 [Lupinus albus]
MTMMMNNNNNFGQFGDTTLTKVFVGGLAWETKKEALREHFEKYGEILEAVIISDKLTGRSKGYGFVTFKEAEAAKKACEDQTTLVINGRLANYNLASLGARRQRFSANASPPPHSQPQPQPQEGSNGGGQRNNTSSTQAANHVQWYYPVGTPASPFHHQTLPYYGYTPTYIAPNVNYNYNQKLSYGSSGAYMSGHHVSHVYPRHAIIGGNTLMPMYPMYHHPTETMGVPAQYFHPTVATHFASVPARIMSKPVSITPHTGQLVQLSASKGSSERSLVG